MEKRPADLPLPAHPAQLLRDDGDRGGDGVRRRRQEGVRRLGAGQPQSRDEMPPLPEGCWENAITKGPARIELPKGQGQLQAGPDGVAF